MADNMLFEIDASKIVAKLHLAGLSQAKAKFEGKDSFIVNSGIVKDDPSASPEDPGKVEFDLALKAYKVGYVTSVQFFDPSSLSVLSSMMSRVQELWNQLYGKDSKIDDKEKSKEFEEYKSIGDSILQFLKSKDIKDKDIDALDSIADIGASNEDSSKYFDAIKNAIQTVQASGSTAIEKIKEEKASIAADVLKTYMENFAGKDKASSISKSTLGAIAVPEDAKDANSVAKKGEIQEAPKQEVDKARASALANFKEALRSGDAAKKDYKNATQKICFYVDYTLDIDK